MCVALPISGCPFRLRLLGPMMVTAVRPRRPAPMPGLTVRISRRLLVLAGHVAVPAKTPAASTIEGVPRHLSVAGMVSSEPTPPSVLLSADPLPVKGCPTWLLTWAPPLA